MNDCMLWDKAIQPNGYGRVWKDGKLRYAHRVAYELVHGPIPHGLVIDHLCRVRHCVNPEHMEAVTNAENLRRGSEAQTHCIKGHERDDDSTYQGRTSKRCRVCRNEYQAEYRAKKAAIVS